MDACVCGGVRIRATDEGRAGGGARGHVGILATATHPCGVLPSHTHKYTHTHTHAGCRSHTHTPMRGAAITHTCRRGGEGAVPCVRRV